MPPGFARHPFPSGSYLQGGAAIPAGNNIAYGCSSAPGGGSGIPLLDWTWAPATAVAAMLCLMYRGRVELKEPDLAVHVACIAARYAIVPLYVQAVAAVEVGQEGMKPCHPRCLLHACCTRPAPARLAFKKRPRALIGGC